MFALFLKYSYFITAFHKILKHKFLFLKHIKCSNILKRNIDISQTMFKENSDKFSGEILSFQRQILKIFRQIFKRNIDIFGKNPSQIFRRYNDICQTN